MMEKGSKEQRFTRTVGTASIAATLLFTANSSYAAQDIAINARTETAPNAYALNTLARDVRELLIKPGAEPRRFSFDTTTAISPTPTPTAMQLFNRPEEVSENEALVAIVVAAPPERLPEAVPTPTTPSLTAHNRNYVSVLASALVEGVQNIDFSLVGEANAAGYTGYLCATVPYPATMASLYGASWAPCNPTTATCPYGVYASNSPEPCGPQTPTPPRTQVFWTNCNGPVGGTSALAICSNYTATMNCTFDGSPVGVGDPVTYYVIAAGACGPQTSICGSGGGFTPTIPTTHYSSLAACQAASPSPTCTYNGTTYTPPQSIPYYNYGGPTVGCMPASTPCNTNGTFTIPSTGYPTLTACTTAHPAPTCTYGGQTYTLGQPIMYYYYMAGAGCISSSVACASPFSMPTGAYPDQPSCIAAHPTPTCSYTLNGALTTVQSGFSTSTYYNTQHAAAGTLCPVSMMSTCNNGTFSPPIPNPVFSSCTDTDSCSVTLITNGTPTTTVVASGGHVNAYDTPTVPYGQLASCSVMPHMQMRRCTNGLLDGSYTYGSCTEQAPVGCTFAPSDAAVQNKNHGEFVNYYYPMTPGMPCMPMMSQCSNGQFINSTLPLGPYYVQATSCSPTPSPTANTCVPPMVIDANGNCGPPVCPPGQSGVWPMCSVCPAPPPMNDYCHIYTCNTSTHNWDVAINPACSNTCLGAPEPTPTGMSCYVCLPTGWSPNPSAPPLCPTPTPTCLLGSPGRLTNGFCCLPGYDIVQPDPLHPRDRCEPTCAPLSPGRLVHNRECCAPGKVIVNDQCEDPQPPSPTPTCLPGSPGRLTNGFCCLPGYDIVQPDPLHPRDRCEPTCAPLSPGRLVHNRECCAAGTVIVNDSCRIPQPTPSPTCQPNYVLDVNLLCVPAACPPGQVGTYPTCSPTPSPTPNSCACLLDGSWCYVGTNQYNGNTVTVSGNNTGIIDAAYTGYQLTCNGSNIAYGGVTGSIANPATCDRVNFNDTPPSHMVRGACSPTPSPSSGCPAGLTFRANDSTSYVFASGCFDFYYGSGASTFPATWSPAHRVCGPATVYCETSQFGNPNPGSPSSVNICCAGPVPSPTPTNTPGPTSSPTPTPTNTPGWSPTPTPTNTPSPTSTSLCGPTPTASLAVCHSWICSGPPGNSWVDTYQPNPTIPGCTPAPTGTPTPSPSSNLCPPNTTYCSNENSDCTLPSTGNLTVWYGANGSTLPSTGWTSRAVTNPPTTSVPCDDTFFGSNPVAGTPKVCCVGVTPTPSPTSSPSPTCSSPAPTSSLQACNMWVCNSNNTWSQSPKPYPSTPSPLPQCYAWQCVSNDWQQTYTPGCTPSPSSNCPTATPYPAPMCHQWQCDVVMPSPTSVSPSTYQWILHSYSGSGCTPTCTPLPMTSNGYPIVTPPWSYVSDLRQAGDRTDDRYRDLCVAGAQNIPFNDQTGQPAVNSVLNVGEITGAKPPSGICAPMKDTPKNSLTNYSLANNDPNAQYNTNQFNPSPGAIGWDFFINKAFAYFVNYRDLYNYNDPSSPSGKIRYYKGYSDRFRSATVMSGGLNYCLETMRMKDDIANDKSNRMVDVATFRRAQAYNCAAQYIGLHSIQPWFVYDPSASPLAPLAGDPNTVAYQFCQPLIRGNSVDNLFRNPGSVQERNLSMAPVFHSNSPILNENEYLASDYIRYAVNHTFASNALSSRLGQFGTTDISASNANRIGAYTYEPVTPDPLANIADQIITNSQRDDLLSGINAACIRELFVNEGRGGMGGWPGSISGIPIPTGTPGPAYCPAPPDPTRPFCPPFIPKPFAPYILPKQLPTKNYCSNVESIKDVTHPFSPRHDISQFITFYSSLQDPDPGPETHSVPGGLFVVATVPTPLGATDRDYSQFTSSAPMIKDCTGNNTLVQAGTVYGYTKYNDGDSTSFYRQGNNAKRYPTVQCAVVPVDILSFRQDAFAQCISQRIEYNQKSWMLNIAQVADDMLNGVMDNPWLLAWRPPCSTRYFELDGGYCPMKYSIQQCCSFITKPVVPMNQLKLRTAEGVKTRNDQERIDDAAQQQNGETGLDVLVENNFLQLPGSMYSTTANGARPNLDPYLKEAKQVEQKRVALGAEPNDYVFRNWFKIYVDQSSSTNTNDPAGPPGIVGVNMPYMRWWDTGAAAGNTTPIVTSPSSTSSGTPTSTVGTPWKYGSFINTLGGWDVIVGTGREGRDTDEQKDTNKRSTDFQWTTGTQGLGYQHGREAGNLGGWDELVMHQMYTMRFHNLNCIGRYEKLFKDGDADNYVHYATGGSFANKKEQSYPWPIGWRGYAMDLNRGIQANGYNLDYAMPGDIVLFNFDYMRTPAYVENIGFPPDFEAYVRAMGPNDIIRFNESAGRWEILANGQMVTQWAHPDRIYVSAWNFGKFPDSTGITNQWGTGPTRVIFRNRVPDTYLLGNDVTIPSAKVPLFDQSGHMIDWQPSCTDPDYTVCVLPRDVIDWQNTQLYRARYDMRSCNVNFGQASNPSLSHMISAAVFANCIAQGFDPPLAYRTAAGTAIYKGAGTGAISRTSYCGVTWGSCGAGGGSPLPPPITTSR